ncbi:MAG: lysophospholipid acyltransferase family protein [Desulfobacterales bacterium]
MIKTAFVVLHTILATLVLGGVATITAFFSKTGNIPHKVAILWAKSILFVSNVSVIVSGSENIVPGKPYIFMANHQSNFDILALFAGLPVQFRWLAKAELFKIPIFAQGMRGCGYISIDRSNRESAFRSIREASEKIRNGASVMIFPEGTRSMDGNLLPFKKGGFVLAMGSGVPVIPMIITGSQNIMPKKQLSIRSGCIALDILEPIETSSPEFKNKDELLQSVRRTMIEELAKKREGIQGC